MIERLAPRLRLLRERLPVDPGCPVLEASLERARLPALSAG
jgi:hypothetical protein